MNPLADKHATAVSSLEQIGLFQDVPKWIWVMFLSGWVTVFGLFVLFFTNDGGAIFAVTIAALFAIMAFGLPMTMAAQSRCGKHDCKGVVHTRSGPLSSGAAAIQIALIPIAAAIGLTALITFAL
jgi:hypothetical protein